MNVMLMLIREKARTRAGVAALSVIVLACAAWAFVPRTEGPDEQTPEHRLFVKAKRAINGQKIKLDNDNEEFFMLAGIRAPVDQEPFYDEATKRVTQIVEEKKLRLRFDDAHRDSEGRLRGYAFVDDTFINEVLVKEGLAYARVTTENDRFGERLLAAQTYAQKAHRGIWSKRLPGTEKSYLGDPKHGNFHRPSCLEIPKIPEQRLVKLPTDKDALHKGFAPCPKCKP